MLLHVNPDLNLLSVAGDAAQRVSSQLTELSKNLPGYALWRGGALTDLQRRFADAAVPLIVDLALTASDVMNLEVPNGDNSADEVSRGGAATRTG